MLQNESIRRRSRVSGRVWAVPDKGLWREIEIEIARPFDRTVACACSAELRVVRTQTLEYRTPEQIPDVSLNNGPVRETQTEPVVVVDLDRSNSQHRCAILREGLDPDDRLARRSSAPIVGQLDLMLGCPFHDKAECTCREMRRIVIRIVESDNDPEEPAEFWHRTSLRTLAARPLIPGLGTNPQPLSGPQGVG